MPEHGSCGPQLRDMIKSKQRVADLGKGKFQRRDFRLAMLTQMSAISGESTLFAQMGKHEFFLYRRRIAH